MNSKFNATLQINNNMAGMKLPQQSNQNRAINTNQIRIAVASSGLGHIARGIETWADDTANVLHHLGVDVTLYQGGGKAVNEWTHVVPCWKRFDAKSKRFTELFNHIGGWRYGFGSGYQVEQTTFSYHLWKQIRNNNDILHVQDPWIAYCFELLHNMKLSKPRVILAHGTEEPVEFLRKFRYLQHLAPCYIGNEAQKQYAIPNFVDTDIYRPGNKNQSRLALGLPLYKTITICVAAIKKQHKRIDVLIDEYSKSSLSQDGLLVIIGSREADTNKIIQYGKQVLGERVLFKIGLRRNEMPCYYQAADIFALASIHEMMPIAMLEALASGLPIACNNTPVMTWISGEAAFPCDISQNGALTRQLNRLSNAEIRKRCSIKARERAIDCFSSISVVSQMIDMYKDVMNENA